MGRPGFSLQRRLARRRLEAREAPESSAPAASGPPPGFWARFEAGMTRARSLALSGVVLLVLGVVGWSVTQELIRDPVIIEPLAVPESLAKAGWTGEVLARQIRDGIRDINEAAHASPALAPAYLFDREQLDFALPGGLISIRTLATVVRGVLGRPARRVTGELVQLDDDRDRQAVCPEAPRGTSPAGSRYGFIGRLGTAAPRWIACVGAVGDLPRVAAEQLARTNTPFIYAVFQYGRDPAQAKAAAEGILAEKKQQSEHARALNLLGVMLDDKKQFIEAIGMYEEALLRDPDYAAAYINWGNALRSMERPEEAIGMYEEAKRRDPNFADVYYNWGNALRDLKRPEEAISKYQEALRRDPDIADAYNGWANAQLDLKRPEEAIGKYREALRRDPDIADAYNGWGNALRDLKRPEEAIGKYQQALRGDRNSAFAYNGWGSALLDLNHPKDAIDKFQEALRRDPDFALAYYNWGLALIDLGRNNEATAKRAIADCLSQGRTSGDCLASADAGKSPSPK